MIIYLDTTYTLSFLEQPLHLVHRAAVLLLARRARVVAAKGAFGAGAYFSLISRFGGEDPAARHNRSLAMHAASLV